MMDLEQRGIPSVGVFTTEFVEALAVQAEALGVDPASVIVPHPVQDRTNDELRAMADVAFDKVVTELRA